jgi:hypothetical protein
MAFSFKASSHASSFDARRAAADAAMRAREDAAAVQYNPRNQLARWKSVEDAGYSPPPDTARERNTAHTVLLATQQLKAATVSDSAPPLKLQTGKWRSAPVSPRIKQQEQESIVAFWQKEALKSPTKKPSGQASRKLPVGNVPEVQLGPNGVWTRTPAPAVERNAGAFRPTKLGPDGHLGAAPRPPEKPPPLPSPRTPRPLPPPNVLRSEASAVVDMAGGRQGTASTRTDGGFYQLPGGNLIASPPLGEMSLTLLQARRATPAMPHPACSVCALLRA